MIDYDDYNKYLDRRVSIKSISKSTYAREKLLGMCGTVEKISSNSLGVLIDGKTNKMSAYGIYWFDINEVNFLKDEREDIKMEGFKNVAIVNLLDDYNKKDYAFALYDEDLDLMAKSWNNNAIVVVNARGKDNRQLAIVKEIMPTESYNKTKITAEVVGVVNMKNYIARENEKVRLKELAEKKAAIEKELEAEINKRKSVEYYEAMANKYSDNPKLAELVAELKNLGA